MTISFKLSTILSASSIVVPAFNENEMDSALSALLLPIAARMLELVPIPTSISCSFNAFCTTALSEETLTVMSDMAESLAANAATFMEEIRPVRNHMCERIFAEIEDVELNGHKEHHLTNHLNIRIKNVSAAVVQKA